MDMINLSDLKSLISKAHATLCVVLHALETKVLVGEINHPSPSPPKIKRKRRTKKEIALNATAGHVGMNLEKEYQIERLPTLIPTLQEKDLPEDKDPFFAKAKRVYKKREKKEPTGGNK